MSLKRRGHSAPVSTCCVALEILVGARACLVARGTHTNLLWHHYLLFSLPLFFEIWGWHGRAIQHGVPMPTYCLLGPALWCFTSLFLIFFVLFLFFLFLFFPKAVELGSPPKKCLF